MNREQLETQNVWPNTEIAIPETIGYIEINRLKPEGNIIFVSDNHISYKAQVNISLLYIHLAQQYGLTLFSPENHPVRQTFTKGNPHASRSSWESVIKRQQVGMWTGDNSPDQLFYPSIIAHSAFFLGFDLDLVDSGQEGQLVTVDLLHNYHFHPATNPTTNTPLHPDVQTAYDSLDPRLQRALSAMGGPTIENIRYLRTAEHVNSVANVMRDGKKDLALMSRGDAHKNEFVSVAESLGLGYLVFIPEGLFLEDPLLTVLFNQKIAAIQKSLVQPLDK